MKIHLNFMKKPQRDFYKTELRGGCFLFFGCKNRSMGVKDEEDTYKKDSEFYKNFVERPGGF